ncbi:NAD(P)-dependent dehydrogenase, short-chain alcohol dehydrogenase family [Salinihabitans flavidus]|uniref:NAD(P)-dependent dehydrogenase, short-chain alcohol dehydrogenase family n=1 Tax=Salinihabitans flavidus TaxID=569882 RepID=A0A1H8U3F3_9RHOB|nr:3-hydroxyacyl-CoA dehydrogenase [Salinihabitans flavidus]SEO97617.1 NAD(P)-dependent dehydrogenase, short-chain alcohol dehydrogenase family [Salinihabitans flavidus]
MDIQSTIAVVTGGASGLGEATVRELAAGGAKVGIFDRDAERGEAVATELGENVIFCSVDVTDEASVNTALDTVSERFGAINAVVNCAGIAIAAKTVGRDGPHALDAYRKVIDVNLVGTFNVLRLTAARMEKNAPNEDGERGAIVNTASVAAFDGQKGQAAYAASKGGVVATTLPVARDLGRSGIRINTIAPGLFLTPMFESLGEEVCKELAKDVVFPARLGRPSEYARLASFLLSHPYMNGETIRLDGALRMP